MATFSKNPQTEPTIRDKLAAIDGQLSDLRHRFDNAVSDRNRTGRERERAFYEDRRNRTSDGTFGHTGEAKKENEHAETQSFEIKVTKPNEEPYLTHEKGTTAAAAVARLLAKLPNGSKATPTGKSK